MLIKSLCAEGPLCGHRRGGAVTVFPHFMSLAYSLFKFLVAPLASRRSKPFLVLPPTDARPVGANHFWFRPLRRFCRAPPQSQPLSRHGGATRPHARAGAPEPVDGPLVHATLRLPRWRAPSATCTGAPSLVRATHIFSFFIYFLGAFVLIFSARAVMDMWATCRVVSLRDTARGGVREMSPHISHGMLYIVACVAAFAGEPVSAPLNPG
jgi:hypothetical protein